VPITTPTRQMSSPLDEGRRAGSTAVDHRTGSDARRSSRARTTGRCWHATIEALTSCSLTRPPGQLVRRTAGCRLLSADRTDIAVSADVDEVLLALQQVDDGSAT